MPENSDDKTSISYFKEEVQKFVEERGWTRFHTPKNLVQALNCEAGELSQLLLFKDHEIKDVKGDETLMNALSEEIADVFIYLISLINTLGIDLSESFDKKMKKNCEKYSSSEFNNGIYYKK